MINVIATTKSLTLKQIRSLIDKFHKQDLLSKKLVIMNNYPSWELCLKLPAFNSKYVEVYDKPFASDIKAQSDALDISDKFVAQIPTSYDVPDDWLSTWLMMLLESDASLVYDGRECFVAKRKIIPRPYVFENVMDELVLLAEQSQETIIKHSF